MQVQICSGYSGRDPGVRNFFFGAGYRGTMENSDKAILAIEGPAIVGGILLRGQEMICQVGTARVCEKLSKESGKISAK